MAASQQPRFGLLAWSILLLFVPFLYAWGFCWPRGDDFDNATRAMFLFDLPGGFYEIGRAWLNWSGRYGFHFLAVFLGKVVDSPLTYGLTCAAVPALAGLAVGGLARLAVPGMARRDAVFLGALSCLAQLCSYAYLPTYYLETDALTMGLQSSLALCLVWRLCQLWQDSGTPDLPQAQLRRSRRWAIATGILAVGIYEHSALAVNAVTTTALVLAWLENYSGRRTAATNIPPGRTVTATRLKELLRLWLYCFGALLFSYLAPGNFHRREVRQVSAEASWTQLGQAGQEWLDTAFGFFHGPWPWLLVLLLILVHLARPARSGDSPARQAQPLLRLGMIILPVLVYLAFSFMLAVLHATSDVTLSESVKFPAGLSVYLALACGISLWWLTLPLVQSPAFSRLVSSKGRGLSASVLLLFAAICCTTGNLPALWDAALDGRIAAVGEALSSRSQWLHDMGRLSFGPDSTPRFGLAGEIYRPGVRSRKLDPNLPWAMLPVQSGQFPIWYETLPAHPEQWPNLWAAWYYGVGGICAVGRPSPEALNSPGLPLSLPAAQDELAGLAVGGLTHIRLIQPPNPQYRNGACDGLWLVLQSDSPLPARLAVREGQDGIVRHYRTADWQQGNIIALPLGPARELEGYGGQDWPAFQLGAAADGFATAFAPLLPR